MDYQDPGDIRPPPCSIPAEQSLLGAAVTGRAAWPEVAELVEESDFYQHAHRVLFRALAELYDRGEPIDLVTVCEHLERTRQLEDAGGLPYVGSLVTAAGAAANCPSYARAIRRTALERRAMALGSRLADGADIAASLEELNALAEQATGPGNARPPKPADLIATEAELSAAHLAPRCIVERHTYADVAQLIAAGGTGKTTVLILEAVHSAIGRPVWGLEVLSPGWTLFVSAEDRRSQILARLREILASMDLDETERAAAIRGVRVWDVTGEAVKLVRAADGNVILTGLADAIVTAYRDDPPAVVVFDPLVSFGASEGMINDNEQAVVTAARRIVKGLDCCVRIVHHTGKGNAREKTLDQYSGRGGSAMPDGSRMTTVLQQWTPDDGGSLRPPPGCIPEPGSSITIMARAKLSYAPPNLPLIWIKRTGFAFESFTELPQTRDEARAAKADQVWRFLVSELDAGRHHTQRGLDDLIGDLGMSRRDLRRALTDLRAASRVTDAPLPDNLRQGSRKTYLHPANRASEPGAVDQGSPPNRADEYPPATTAPPYREMEGGAVAAPSDSPCPVHCAASIGAVPAQWRSTELETATETEEVRV